MKNKTRVAVLLAALTFGTASYAQLGGLGKKARNAVSKEKGGKKGESSVKLDWKMYPQTAAITMESLLENTQLYPHGNLRTNFYHGTFVPNKTASGQTVEPLYSAGEGVFKTKLYVGDELVKEGVYDGGEFWSEGKKMSFECKNLTDCDTDITKEGKYRLDFYAGDNLFYTFSFDVAKKVNTDPYASESTLWYAQGPWEKMAFVTPQNTGNFIFGFYLMHTDFKPNANDPRKTTKSVAWYPELLKDGKVISVKNKNTAILQKGEWKSFNTSIKLINGKDWLKIADLADGNYTYRVTVEGEAAPRNYKFSMKGGQIVLGDKQDRTKNTDPKTLVEGWNNFFWLERS